MNVGIIGCGSIASAHARALAAMPDVQLVAAMDPCLETVRGFSARFGIPHRTTDVDACLACAGLDAVIICSPHASHATQAMLALRAGKHVLVEIPLALSLEECRALAHAVELAGLCLMVAHTNRFARPARALRALIESGALHVHHVLARYAFLRREHVNWEGRARAWSDHLLWHHGAHAVDQALWLLGTTAFRVQARMGSLHPDLHTPMDIDVIIETAAGQSINVFLSYNAHAACHDYLVVGEEDTLTLTGQQLCNSAGDVLAVETPHPIFRQDVEFIDAIRGRRRASVSPDQVLPAMEVLHRVQEGMR